MDGANASGELVAPRETRGVRFEIAMPTHDAAIRRLFRETVMRGGISVSMERDPSHFAAAAIEGSEHQTIVAIEDERVVATGSVSTRSRFTNGVPTRVGYMSGLRVAESHRGRASLVRRGYEFLHQLHQQGGPPIYLTSIVSDNNRARRLLERGLKGMPKYDFLGEFVTLIIGRKRRSDLFKPTSLARRQFRDRALRVVYGSQELVPTIIELLNANRKQYQFSPACSAEDLYAAGLSPDDFRLACRPDGEALACAAIWDQRGFKQTIVRDYSPRLRRMRPLINLGAALIARPRLPAVGEPLSFAFVSHLACDADQAQLAEWLIRLLHGPAHTRNIDYLTIGFDARDPRLRHLRKAFRPREYLSRLYAVHWDDGAELVQGLDDRPLAPEVALL